MPDLDVFKNLPQASFRGIPFPILSRDRCNHEHDTVQHGLQYRSQKLVETTGSGNLMFGYTIPFRQGIAIGGYENLFTTTYQEFWLAYVDDSPGELVDPIRGLKQVIPVSWAEQCDVNKRDGIDVAIVFMDPGDIAEDADYEIIGTIQTAYNAAGELDQEITRIDWEQEPMPEPATDPLTAIAGVGEQIDRNRSQVDAALNDFAYKLERIEQSFERLEDPERAAKPIHSARRLRLAASKLRQRGANPAQTIKRVNTTTELTISGLARETNAEIDDLLRLNWDLASLAIIPAGFPVNVPS